MQSTTKNQTKADEENIYVGKKRTAVVIPSYDRDEDLRKSIPRILELHGKFDVFVVDDSSPSDRIKEFCENHPSVKYMQTPRNLGVIGARNHAMDLLSLHYDFLFHFDDDSIPLCRDHITRSLAEFDAYPEMAVLSYPVISDDQYQVNLNGSVEKFCYVGCANSWRTAVIPAIGLYSTIFERQGEEMEHSFRVWKSGYTVRRLNDVPVFHWQSATNRNLTKIAALNSTAYLKWSLIHWPVPILLLELFRWMIFTLRRSLMIDWKIWQDDLKSESYGIGAALATRSPVNASDLKSIRRLFNEYRMEVR